jgi:hypothetical protein
MTMTPEEVEKWYAKLKFARYLVDRGILTEGDPNDGVFEGLGAVLARLHPVSEHVEPQEASSGAGEVAPE